MPAVPTIASKPAEPLPRLEVRVDLAPDDWAEALLRTNGVDPSRQRRWILVFLLPCIWFATLLGAFSIWATEGSDRDLATFLNDVAVLPLAPIAVFLAVASLAVALAYLLRRGAAMRKVRRLLRETGFVRAIPLSYIFDEAGVTAVEDGRTTLLPWSRIRSIEETQDHLFLLCGGWSEPVVLPRRRLAQDDLASARRWAEQRMGAQTPRDPSERVPADAGALRLAVTLEGGDAAALIARTQRLPHIRRARLAGFLLAWLGLSLIGPLLFVFLWVIDPYRVPFAHAFPLFVEMFPGRFWWWALPSGLVVGAVFLFRKTLLGWSAAAAGSHMLEGHDPPPLELTLGEDGIEIEHGPSTDRIGWGAVKGVERTQGHVVLLLSRGSAFPLPLRGLDADGLARLEALLARHIDRSERRMEVAT